MKNILVITIDSLSKWYIDILGKEISFFDEISKKSLNLLNLYSTGPFTEAAISGMWYGLPSLVGWNYLFENNYNEENIFSMFDKMGYKIYLGELVPFYSNRMHCKGSHSRENPVDRAFEHIWRGRIRYFCGMGTEKIARPDYLSMEWILNSFFAEYRSFSSKVNEEENYYLKNKKKYIDEIIELNNKSHFYSVFYSELYKICNEKGCVEFENTMQNPFSGEELLLSNRIKILNRKRIQKFNSNLYSNEELSKVFEAPTNRCVITNDNSELLMRNRGERLPKLYEELKDFLNWYDGRNSDEKFMAYIHNYDFHYPEDFLNIRYEKSKDQYKEELKRIECELEEINSVPMSVTKQLTIRNIDRLLGDFVNKLKRRGFFNDSVMVITADHGMTNFMYPIKRKKNERWIYNSANFNVPFYAIGVKNPQMVNSFLASTSIPKILIEVSEERKIEIMLKNSLVTSWINGTPDIQRKDIRYGYRSFSKQVTIQLKLTEFLVSSEIIGVYYIEDDPDELINKKFDLKKKDIEKILRLFSDEWQRLIVEYLIGDGLCKVYKSRYAEILREQYNYLCIYNMKFEFVDEKNFFHINKRLIVCGEDEKTKKFIEQLPSSVCIEVILTLDNISSFCGHNCNNILDNNDWTHSIIVASEREVEFVALLNYKNINEYVLNSQLV